ncbi:MAG TPA: ABC transporter substrate-binding protein [Chthoniobacteraceae bacterium]|jgi:NitT/TauT family transport system substrate-binding protein
MKRIIHLASHALALTLLSSIAAAAETIRIGIGTQDTTINCAAGGAVVRELKLLEKHLPRDGKYKDAKFDVVWHNFPSGPPLNNELLANKLDIGNMADFPSILGRAAFDNAKNGVRTLYIATLSGGINGAGNAVLVPIGSKVQSFAELKGKRISVPFGSTGHAMLLRAIKDHGWDPERDVSLVSQAPEVGGSALKANQIDAHANFVPFGELFPFRGIARKIYDGSSTGVTTTHGVQVRSDFAEKYPELVVAYLKATLEADQLLREKPEELSEKLAGWTGVEAEVHYAFHGPAGIQTRDFTLKPEYVAAIRQAEVTLRELKRTDRTVNVDDFVTDKFIRQAAKEFGADYNARLADYSPLPLSGKAHDTGAPIAEPKLAGQIWVKGEAQVRLYSSPEATLAAAKQLGAEAKSVRVTYVHDRNSRNKLFADKVWYVNHGGKLAAFLLKESATEWATKNGGDVVAFEDASKALGDKTRQTAKR